MNIGAEKRLKYFKISWFILLISTVCDYNITDKLSLGFFSVNVQASSIALVIYLFVFVFTFPIKELTAIFNSKYDKINIYILAALLLIAYISSYFSLMQKYAIVTTTSRYTLYFLSLLITLCYVKHYKNAGEFILKSFIYVNLFIALSSLAEYFIPAFYRLLVDHFGIMESRHAVMKLGDQYYMRPSGFITDSNLTAFTLGLSSYFLLLNRGKFNRFFEYSFYLIAGISFGLIASRSALITVIFLLFTLIVFRQVNWKNGLVYFILFLLVQLITPQTQARFFNISDKKKNMEEIELGRPLIWKADYLAMREKPVIGIGSGVFFKQSEIYIAKIEKKINDSVFFAGINNPAPENKQGINPHNIFFTMQIEHGIGGTLLFVILVIFNLIFLIRYKKFNSLAVVTAILFVSSLSNYAPYYKYYLLIVLISYVLIFTNFKPDSNVQRG